VNKNIENNIHYAMTKITTVIRDDYIDLLFMIIKYPFF